MPAPEGIVHKLGPYVHRLQPRSLRGRMAVAACAFSVLGVVATFGLVHFTAVAQFDAFAAGTARQQLVAFRAFLIEEQGDVDLHAAALVAATARHYSQPVTSTSAPTWVTDRLRAARCTSFVRTDATGRVIVASGPAAELSALAALVARTSAEDTSGIIWAGEQPVVVSVRTLEATGAASPGRLALARPLDATTKARFAPLAEGLSVSFRPPAASPVSRGTAIAGFAAATTEERSGTSRTVVELPGVASMPAGLAQLDLHDARLTNAMTAAGRVALMTALLVGLLGGALGLVLASSVRAPIDRTRRHLREEATLALEGLPCEPLGARPETTSEFRALAYDVDGLLTALSRRQAELVEATEQARAAQESLRAALDGSPEGKLLVEDGLVVLANPAAEAILGIPLAELVGMRVLEIPARVRAFLESGDRIDAGGASRFASERPLVARLEPPDEPERWVEATQVHLDREAGRFLLSVRDITEERRLDAMHEEIFSIVSHDLRAPLTVVQGYLDILERPLQPEARQRALDSARHNASKMAALLEDLLDATTAEGLLAPKNPQPLDLVTLASEVAVSAKPASIGHTFDVVAEGPCVVIAEERRLRQALMNLVMNAVKFSPEETVVTLRIESDDACARLAVEDEGPGVPPEARAAVFERYERHAATAEGKPGFGLGLYIVRMIAENHGGSTRVEDAPGGGARFVIELPLPPEG